MTRFLCGPLLAASALSFASPAVADTLVYNVDGITIDEDGSVKRFTQLVFDDEGIITHVLTRGEERPEGIDFAMDGEGQVMLPGMIDAHVNLMDIGFGELILDLSQSSSLDNALGRIAAFAETNQGRPWILGRGWDDGRWGLDRLPTTADLDAVAPDRPIWLLSADGASGWANSLALELAGLDVETLDPAGGRIRRDTQGNPTGIFVGTAKSLIEDVIPAPRPEDRATAFALAQEKLLANGVTAVADMGTSLVEWMTYRRAADQDQLRLRIMVYADSLEAMELIGGSGPTPWLYEDRLRLNGVAFNLDGTVASRSAWMREPYADETENSGTAQMSAAQLRNRMSRAALDNFQTAVRANGDLANEELLLAIEELALTYQGDRRWRIEGATIVAEADLARFGENGAIASMQPLTLPAASVVVEARIGEERLAGIHAWRSIKSAGGILAFGSSAPSNSANPFHGIATAISRTDEAGEPFGGWRPQESVTREHAFAAFTANAAFAGFAEGRFGRLVVGERADFLFVDRDPLLSSPDNIRNTRVIEVWIAGQRVFARAGR
ncbi:MAG: amidohydrolase [Pseudomonadota bacterium]